MLTALPTIVLAALTPAYMVDFGNALPSNHVMPLSQLR